MLPKEYKLLAIGATASALAGMVAIVLAALLPHRADDSWRGYP